MFYGHDYKMDGLYYEGKWVNITYGLTATKYLWSIDGANNRVQQHEIKFTKYMILYNKWIFLWSKATY